MDSFSQFPPRVLSHSVTPQQLGNHLVTLSLMHLMHEPGDRGLIKKGLWITNGVSLLWYKGLACWGGCRYTVTILSLYCLYPVAILSLYCLFTVTILSLYWLFTVTILSLYCLYTVPILSLYSLYTVPILSLYCLYTLNIVSLYCRYTLITLSLYCHYHTVQPINNPNYVKIIRFGFWS